MSNEEKGFVMVDPDHSAKFLTPYISLFSGLKEGLIFPAEIRLLYSSLAYDICNPELFSKYGICNGMCDDEPSDPKSKRELAERKQRFYQFAEACLYLPPKHKSYGLFAPSYLYMLRENQARNHEEPSASHDALLVGALTVETIQEYNAVVKTVYPNAHTFVIDRRGSETSHTPNYCFGDGLEMPFKSECMDSVHTNYLLHQLNGSPKDDQTKRGQLFREMIRVLRPGGNICMVESNLGLIYLLAPTELIVYLLTEELKSAGFSDIAIKPAHTFKSRRSVCKFLRSSKGTICTDDFHHEDPNVLAISAVKPNPKPQEASATPPACLTAAQTATPKPKPKRFLFF